MRNNNSTCHRSRRGRQWHQLLGSNPSRLDALGGDPQDRMWWICKEGVKWCNKHQQLPRYLSSLLICVKALDWPDPVNAELLRGGMQGGHVLSHPVILVEGGCKRQGCIFSEIFTLGRVKKQLAFTRSSHAKVACCEFSLAFELVVTVLFTELLTNLEHMKQGCFACIIQPWKEYLFITMNTLSPT